MYRGCNKRLWPLAYNIYRSRVVNAYFTLLIYKKLFYSGRRYFMNSYNVQRVASYKIIYFGLCIICFF